MPLTNRVCFLVNLRDRLCCRRCGKGPESREHYHQGFEYHHLLPRSQGGQDTAENVVLLCHDCHTGLHRSGQRFEVESTQPPTQLECFHCGSNLDPNTVEMNCGWYHCPHCQRQTHLFDHFQGALKPL